MISISSISNRLVKDICTLHSKKGREISGNFLIEGTNSVAEAVKDNLKIKLIAFKEGAKPSDFLLNKAQELYSFSEPVMKKVSTTDSPASVIAVCEQLKCSLKDILTPQQNSRLIVVLDEIKDPGNLGTIIRTSAAAAVDGIILTDASVDIYNPKIVRSTAGCLWKVPVIYHKNKKDLIKDLKNLKIKLYASDASGALVYSSANFNSDVAIIFGSEAQGLSDEFLAGCDEKINIPISKKVESLNVASSVAIILFEVIRQKNFNR